MDTVQANTPEAIAQPKKLMALLPRRLLSNAKAKLVPHSRLRTQRQAELTVAKRRDAFHGSQRGNSAQQLDDDCAAAERPELVGIGKASGFLALKPL